MKVLVCGGAGYIGSHTTVALCERGHDVVVLDNLSNSSELAVQRAREIANCSIPLVKGDVRDRGCLREVLGDPFDAVIHFAALKSVGESCVSPLRYFENNVAGTITLMEELRDAKVGRLVFSSSATVYGEPESLPIKEDAPLGATNPYGRTKLMIEQMIEDHCRADASFRAICLRYFNPVGAHPSGLIGEDPSGHPNNLMPYISQVAVGRRERLSVFGADYPTNDGTGVRDYVHVVDLADAHVAAVEVLQRLEGCTAVNVGTGKGTSVLELVRLFEEASGKQVPIEVSARRDGDVAALWADVSRAQTLLGWRARYDVKRMCVDAWRWQSRNPFGYRPDIALTQ